MAKTKTEEYRNLTLDELKDKLDGLKKDYMQKRFQAQTGKLERFSEMKQVQKDIARMMTVMTEKKAEAKS